MFARWPKEFSWMSEKDQKIILLREVSSPYKVIFWTPTVQFWPLHRKNFDKKPQFFSLSVRNWFFFFKQFYETFSQPKTFVCARRMQFWQTRRNCFDSRPKNISLVSENALFFRKIILLRSVLLDTEKVVMTNISKNFREKAETYPLDVRRWVKLFFFRKNVSPKCSSGNVGSSFDNPASTFLVEGQKVFSTGPRRKYFFNRNNFP